MSLKFSPNEGYVVQRLLEHASTKTIAAEMKVSVKTVQKYTERARWKRGAASTEELLTWLSLMVATSRR